MKKRCFVFLSAFMIAAMMLCTASTAASAPAKPVELKLASRLGNHSPRPCHSRPVGQGCGEGD